MLQIMKKTVSISVWEHRGRVHTCDTREEAIQFLERLEKEGKTGEIIIETYERIRLKGHEKYWN